MTATDNGTPADAIILNDDERKLANLLKRLVAGLSAYAREFAQDKNMRQYRKLELGPEDTVTFECSHYLREACEGADFISFSNELKSPSPPTFFQKPSNTDPEMLVKNDRIQAYLDIAKAVQLLEGDDVKKLLAKIEQHEKTLPPLPEMLPAETLPAISDSEREEPRILPERKSTTTHIKEFNEWRSKIEDGKTQGVRHPESMENAELLAGLPSAYRDIIGQMPKNLRNVPEEIRKDEVLAKRKGSTNNDNIAQHSQSGGITG